ncbi:hypothetical protein CVT24_009351 [Panaeolus cyanescens]|uniref:Uncharacterized protein n=1 Tax=Panaeolus cyanescens TaxID=181874 RepID=A0A409Y805_9AGAR|nr:hypothetical protein CVT24_009351 [Panaeolus cyanescens]
MMYSQFRVVPQNNKEYQLEHNITDAGDSLSMMGVFAIGPISKAVAGSIVRYNRRLITGGVPLKRPRKSVARCPPDMLEGIPESYMSEFKASETTPDTPQLDTKASAWNPAVVTTPAWKMADPSTLADLSAYIKYCKGLYGSNSNA